MAASPLTEGGRTVGALNVDSCELGAFNEEDLRLLVLMANEASRVLENMWMIQQLRKKSRSVTKSGFIESGYLRDS